MNMKANEKRAQRLADLLAVFAKQFAARVRLAIKRQSTRKSPRK